MKKLAMMFVAGAMAACLAGCGGAPSVSEFEAKLKEYNKKIEIPMPDALVKASVEAYEKAPAEQRQKMFDELVKDDKNLPKKDK